MGEPTALVTSVPEKFALATGRYQDAPALGRVLSASSSRPVLAAALEHIAPAAAVQKVDAAGEVWADGPRLATPSRPVGMLEMLRRRLEAAKEEVARGQRRLAAAGRSPTGRRGRRLSVRPRAVPPWDLLRGEVVGRGQCL